MIIEYRKLNLLIEAVDALSLPDYKGSTFRGAFGNAFKRVVCTLKKVDCNDCILKTKCIYAYVFETSPINNHAIMGMNKYYNIPHPFVIEPPQDTKRTYTPEEKLSLNLILIGKASDYLPYFIYTFEELGKIGIGRRKGKYRLLKVDSEGKTTYSHQDKIIRNVGIERLYIPDYIDFTSQKPNMNESQQEGITDIILRFLTPVRIKYGRSLTAKLEFHILLRALLRRLCLLHYFHCCMKEPSWDHRQIISEAEKVTIERDQLEWYDWERYSSRQDVRMKMGGLIGEIKYKGNIKPFKPILEAGEILHVGKNTSFGLGKYVLHNI